MSNLEALRKFVTQHEVKIDDLSEETKNEANKKKKKELETALKKLQTDEKYLKALDEIREEEAREKREAERALLSQAAAGKAASSAKGGKSEKAQDAKVDVKADEATMAGIDAAFSNSGKDAADAKAIAVTNLETLAAATPFTLPRLEKLIPLFDHSKLGAPAVKAACTIATAMAPKGHGIATVVMPALLAGMEDKKWKTKVGCIQVLLPCLKQMEGVTPAQLADCLPPIVSKLAEAALEVRAEIRSATGAVLKELGSLVASPEIKELSADLVTALAEPTNQKHTQGVLARMGNQTFKSTIDEASLALLLPIVLRGLKDREAMSKKWSAQIFGSTSMLVKDVDFLKPYLKTALPLLQGVLMDSVPEVQREGAKAFGVLEQVLPEFSRAVNQPWLFGRLRGGDSAEQIGAALAIAEVCVRMEKSRLMQLIPEIELGARHETWVVRRGFLELMDTMPQALKMDFVPFIERLFPAMLMGITGDKDATEDPALKASLALVQRFGDLCPDLLLPAFEGTYFLTLSGANAGERQQRLTVREKAVSLLNKMAEKILEHKKFGQDLLTTEDCSNKETRERLLCLAFVTRYDPDAAVKRTGNGLWKTAGGAPKMQKAIMAALEQMVLRMRSGVHGAGAQKVALEVIADLVKAGDIEAPADETPAPVDANPFPTPVSVNADAANIVAGLAPASSEAVAGEESKAGDERTARVVDEHLERSASFAALPADVRAHCAVVGASVVREGLRKKAAGPQLVAELVKALEDTLATLSDAAAAVKGELPAATEAAIRALLGDAFDAKVDAAGDAEILLRVENMLLMYGAGKLLLKDTCLEMKANRRYGVVGHNGAGKTTLMKEIVHGRIVGMPTHLKCVHVDDSKLGEMSKSSLNALEYVVKKALEIDVHNAGRETLLKVGFPEKMFEEPVAELSTGWRMRLTLAVSMLKHADIVLLDEPTNHLDEESVEWLSDYLLTLTRSSVMVISHEPKFLNKVCTDIISYKDKKLIYTDGNFDAFVMAKGIKANDIEALLSGNLCLDDEVAEEGAEASGEGEAAKRASVAAPITGPPKISFPIPGSVEGVKSSSRAVIEIKNLSFRYSKDKDYLINNVSGKLSLGSRVAICGRNGCGKSTLMTLICSELNSTEGKDGNLGEVFRHCNLRVAYMKQDHLKTLGPYFDTSPLVYITQRFQHGYDEELQKRLIEPEDEEEAERRVALAKVHGKYGNEVECLVGRSKQGTQLVYEVKWKGLDDQKQNTMEPISKLRAMGLDRVVIACDERIAAKAAGLDQRPLTRREIVKHCEAFGIDEEMCCNQQIRGFSAGQKVRLSLAAMFWTKPHFIAVDEPTNYLDVETVEALAKALTNFRGGIVMIEPKSDFVEKVCNETWTLENGEITVAKLSNGNKRTA